MLPETWEELIRFDEQGEYELIHACVVPPGYTRLKIAFRMPLVDSQLFVNLLLITVNLETFYLLHLNSSTNLDDFCWC